VDLSLDPVGRRFHFAIHARHEADAFECRHIRMNAPILATQGAR
jgi:hypothetical protein